MLNCDEIPPKLHEIKSEFLSHGFTAKEIGWEEWFCQAAQFQTILFHSPNGFAIASLDGKFISVNPALTQILGYTEKELLCIGFQDITHPDDLEEDLRSVEQFLQGKISSYKKEKRYKHKDGQYLWIEMDLTLIQNEKGFPNYFVAQLQDISERKYSEKALKETEENFKQLAGTVDEAFWMKDAESGKLLYVSPAYESIWGKSRESLFENPDSWLDSVLPEDKQAALDTIPRKKEDGNLNGKFRIRHMDGAEHWIRLRNFPVFGPNGNFERILSSARDITKQHELEKQLIHSQRMESIGSLAGGVAHDFNNILTVILGFTTLLEKNSGQPEKIQQYTGIIRKTAERGASLVRQLLTLARKVESFLRPLILNDILSEAANIASSTFPKSIRISLEATEEPILINADHTQIHQVFLNLFLNAKDAMPDGGTLSLKLKKEQCPFSDEEGDVATLEIQDSGIGMDEETVRKIFDPFFTTKEPGKGTGLGLSIVYGILENHKSKIQVESELGEGTKFTIYFPILGSSLPKIRDKSSTTKSISENKKTVLLVEDEEMLRISFSQYLAETGHTALYAKDGTEALSVYHENADKIDLVICDLNLPNENGLSVLKKIRSSDPNKPLVLASGYIDPNIRKDLENLNLKRILQKPYHFENILKLLEEIP
ncbi:hybrid sensor histidine kinase/response regulator [Leptospira sarikeiensis]|uniref:histidine kinase n=1 Tax=Leptospira sarikeiensis TaxID=2484943 RepID=A0A4R9K2N6_9LEPT|nr:PAS domain S-box protein [Leptospira sarikeiensis]TGL58405.1 PAS domain S-box protein [Leptospira sarikeiensis]